MRTWLLGGLAALGAAGVVACGGSEAEVEEELGTIVAGHKNDDNKNQCSADERERFCERIEADKNITQVFIDLPRCFDERDVEKVVVFDRDNRQVRVYSGRELKEVGGPCGEIERDFWFPLQGNQNEAKVCVFFEEDVKKIPKDVAISFKAGGTCYEDDEVDGDDCKRCDGKKDDHDGKGRDRHFKPKLLKDRSYDGWKDKDLYRRD